MLDATVLMAQERYTSGNSNRKQTEIPPRTQNANKNHRGKTLKKNKTDPNIFPLTEASSPSFPSLLTSSSSRASSTPRLPHGFRRDPGGGKKKKAKSSNLLIIHGLASSPRNFPISAARDRRGAPRNPGSGFATASLGGPPPACARIRGRRGRGPRGECSTSSSRAARI